MQDKTRAFEESLAGEEQTFSRQAVTTFQMVVSAAGLEKEKKKKKKHSVSVEL